MSALRVDAFVERGLLRCSFAELAEKRAEQAPLYDRRVFNGGAGQSLCDNRQ
jgi:hypothetical protein